MRTIFLILLAGGAFGLAGETTVGNLHVSAPPRLRVYVDGKLAGVTTAEQKGLNIPNLPPGQHHVLVQRAGFQSKKFDVVIQPGMSVDLDVVSGLKVSRRIRRKPREEPVDMAAGSPPMVLDDPDTPGDGNWEINVLFDGDLSSDSDTYESPLMDVNYGCSEKLQFKYEVPYAFTRNVQYDEAGMKQTVRAHGIADSTVGVKYRFYDSEETNLSLAVYPQVEFRTPGARVEKDGGVASSATTWLLPLMVTKDFDRVSTTANLEIEKSTSDRHATLFGGYGVGTRLSDRVAILGDIAVWNLNRAGERRTTIQVGARRKISEQHAIIGSLGFDFTAGSDTQRHRYFVVGYQRSIGHK